MAVARAQDAFHSHSGLQSKGVDPCQINPSSCVLFYFFFFVHYNVVFLEYWLNIFNWRGIWFGFSCFNMVFCK